MTKRRSKTFQYHVKMNAVYFSMNKMSETINLPVELDMRNKGVLLKSMELCICTPGGNYFYVQTL